MAQPYACRTLCSHTCVPPSDRLGRNGPKAALEGLTVGLPGVQLVLGKYILYFEINFLPERFFSSPIRLWASHIGSKTYSGCFLTEVDLWCEYCCSHARIGPHAPERLALGARARRRRAASWGAARSVSSSGLLAGGVPQSARPCSACVRARGWSAGGCRVHTCASA